MSDGDIKVPFGAAQLDCLLTSPAWHPPFFANSRIGDR